MVDGIFGCCCETCCVGADFNYVGKITLRKQLNGGKLIINWNCGEKPNCDGLDTVICIVSCCGFSRFLLFDAGWWLRGLEMEDTNSMRAKKLFLRSKSVPSLQMSFCNFKWNRINSNPFEFENLIHPLLFLLFIYRLKHFNLFDWFERERQKHRNQLKYDEGIVNYTQKRENKRQQENHQQY